MGWSAPRLARAEVAEAIADTDTFWTNDGREFTLDSAFYGRQDGTISFEGYILDDDGDKHYVEVDVTVDRVEVNEQPYNVKNDDWDEEEDEDD
jgi:hypothetical protein